MKFIKLLSFDIKNGLLKNKFLLISAFAFSLFFCIDITYKIYDISLHEKITSSFADYFIYVYGGMKEYVPSPSEPFVFPVIWAIVMLAPAFAVLNYPLNDIQSFGQQVAYRAKSRHLWWISKCFWNALATLSFHALMIGIMLLFCLITKTGINLDINNLLLQEIYKIDVTRLIEGQLTLNISLILTPILISLGLNLLQMALTLFIKPVFSFLAIAAITITSAYLLSPCIPGNYAMVTRSNRIINNGVDFSMGLIVFLALFILSVFIGAIKFKHYDILNKE